MKKERFKSFYKHLPYLNMEELISYFCVFDGYYDLNRLNDHETLLENIEVNILQDYHNLKKFFDFPKDVSSTLYRLAIGSRKHYSIYKDLPKTRGKQAYIYLFEEDIIKKELSRETPIIRVPKQAIKKELRGYKIEDKIRFSKEFVRFWFTFIHPNKEYLEKGEYNQTLSYIKKSLDHFISSFFEELSNILIEDIYSGDIIDSGSYWDREVEIDLFVRLKSGINILGECKWKNHRINKNILNKLKKVTLKADLRADKFALFSKSGFSNELLKSDKRDLLLYDLNSFKRLID